MNRFILIFSLVFILKSASGQNKRRIVQFGTSFVDTIFLPRQDNYIYDITLSYIPRSMVKDFNYHPEKYSDDNFIATQKILQIGKKDSANYILIPPLEPNRFYKLKIKYHDKYNLMGLFLEMSKNDSLDFTTKKMYPWMNTLKYINLKDNFEILVSPNYYELLDLKEFLKNLNLNLPKTKSDIKTYFLNKYPDLVFSTNSNLEDDLLDFCKITKSSNDLTILDNIFIDKIGAVPDFSNVQKYYRENIKRVIENTLFINAKELTSQIDTILNADAKKFASGIPSKASIPNYLTGMQEANKYKSSQEYTTYAKDYQTSYSRSLVPDFGYVVYMPYEGSLKGGSIFLGVHICFSPVNKDIPLQLSKLNFWQRTSLHTGLSFKSLKLDNFREDFFTSNSLMLGGGYKILTQSTRLIGGGMFFKQIDVISGKSKIRAQPYIGLSIDFAIRKWIQETIPFFQNIF